ncbi:MAG TPA: PAS domain-containing protein [Chlorobaculum sp.]|nr:PAS domain-containing protein [Chlorobaculum sp.]
MVRHSSNIYFGSKPVDDSIFALLDSISDPTFLVDPAGEILYTNTAFTERISSYSRVFPGANAFDLHSFGLDIPEIAAGLRGKIEEVLLAGNRLTFEEEQQGKVFRHTITPFFSPDGKITNLFVVVQESIKKLVDLDERKKLNLHKFIHNSVPCSIAIMDAKGRAFWMNQCAKNLIPAKPEGEMHGIDAFETIHPDDRAYAREIFLNILDNDVQDTVEVRRLVQGGTEYSWRFVNGRKIVIDDQPYVLAFGIDITDLKKNQNKLIENQKWLSLALKATHAGVWEWDMKTGECIWSDETWDLYGLERGSATPTFDLWVSSIHPDDRNEVLRVVADSVSEQIDKNVEYRVNYPDGTVHWLMSSGMPLYDDNGSLVRFIGTSIDITRHKETEDALIRSNMRLNLSLEAARAGIWEWDMKTGECIWSDEIWTLSGLEAGQAKASFELLAESIFPEDRESTLQTIADTIKNDAELNFEYRHRYPDGTTKWIMSRGRPLLYEHGHAVSYIGTMIDITEQKQLECDRQKLLESKAGIIDALEKCHIAWWELDLQNKTAHRSSEYDRIFGYETPCPDWTHQKFLDHIIVEDRAEVDRKFQETEANLADWNIKCRIRRTDGEIRWIWAVGGYSLVKTGLAIRLFGLLQDITERERAELERASLQTQLLHSQKMELIGQLAGGIAHDFSNVLTAILGNTELLLRQIDNSHPFFDNLETVRASVVRSADMVRQLLAFARKQPINPKILQIDEAAIRLKPMLRHLTPEYIHYEWLLNSNHASVRIDPSQFDQIMTNLFVNARDAIDGSGTITIETSTENVDRSKLAAGHPCRIPGEYVRLSITDTGYGIEQDVLPHIFEPYFTTKEPGKGTGLGLSTIYGIVKQNGGGIDCLSNPGKGTTFNVYLPMYTVIETREETVEPEPLLQQVNETILLVEDELFILNIIKKVLEEKGYTVLAALNAEDAMIIMNKKREQIKLLVTDIVLPNMNGYELSNRLRESNPELRVLFMSGYARLDIDRDRNLVPGVNFIEKPFTIEDFTRIVYMSMS